MGARAGGGSGGVALEHMLALVVLNHMRRSCSSTGAAVKGLSAGNLGCWQSVMCACLPSWNSIHLGFVLNFSAIPLPCTAFSHLA